MIESDKIQEFEESLSDFLKNGNVEILNWFFEIDSKYNANLLASSTISNKLEEIIITLAPQDENIFDKMINSSKSNLKKTAGIFSNIINEENPEQSTTLLKVLVEKYDEWPNDITKALENKLKKTAFKVEYPHNVPMFETIIGIVSGTVYDQFKSIAEKITPWISEGDINMATEGTRLLESINKKSNPIEPFGISTAIDRTAKLIEETDINFSNLLLKFIFSNPEQLSRSLVKQTTEVLKNCLTVEKPETIRTVGLSFAPNVVEKGYNYGILKKILDLFQNAPEENTKNQCKTIVKNFKNKLSYKEEEQAKELFGETFFDEGG